MEHLHFEPTTISRKKSNLKGHFSLLLLVIGAGK